MSKDRDINIDIQVIKKLEFLFTRTHEDRLKHPYIVLKGGRNGTKSWAVAQYLIFRSVTEDIKVANCREVQKSIKDSTYALLKDTISRFELDHLFKITNTDIVCTATGSEHIFRGLKSQNINSIKSLEGVDVVVVEEAEAVAQESWDKLIPTIRKEGSEIIIVFNPSHELDPTYKQWVTNPPEGTIVVDITYLDNPWISDKSLNEINTLKETDYNKYCHVYLGQPVGNDDLAIIKSEWFNACIDAHKKLGFNATATGVVGFDPSDGGVDASVSVVRKGSVITHIKSMSGLLLEDSTTKTFELAQEHNCTDIVYDSIGVGVGCRIQFDRIDPRDTINKIPYKSSEKPSKGKYLEQHKCQDYFKNHRAELVYKLKDRIFNTYLAVCHGKYMNPDQLISFDTDTISKEDLEQLKYETTNIREVLGGLKLIESKKDMAARGMKSPNIFDSLYQTLATENRKKEIKLNYNWLQ